MSSDVISLLCELIALPSVNDPIRGVKPSPEVAKYIRDFLNEHGVESDIVESNGYFSVFGSVGEGVPHIMFLAHYDTVPADASRWRYDPFKPTISDGRLYGRGALDDKSNVAAIMLTLVELSRVRLNGRVLFAFTGDEEVGGRDGALLVVKKLANDCTLPKYLINGDGANHVVINRRRKIFEVVIKVPMKSVVVRGRRYTKTFNSYYPVSQHAHAAYFLHGVDSHPLVSASAYVRESKHYVASVNGNFLKSNVVPSTVNVDLIAPDPQGDELADHGLTNLIKSIVTLVKTPIRVRAFSEYGVSITPNMYYASGDYHTLVLDVRSMSYKDDVEEAFNTVVKRVLPEAECFVATDDGGFINTPEDSTLIKVFTKILNELNIGYVVGEGAGASDSRYFVTYGVEVVDFGPVGGGMHGDDEYVDITSLKSLPVIYKEVAKQLINAQQMRHEC